MLIFVSDNIVHYFWCSMPHYIATSYRLLQWQLWDIWRWGIEVVANNTTRPSKKYEIQGVYHEWFGDKMTHCNQTSLDKY